MSNKVCNFGEIINILNDEKTLTDELSNLKGIINVPNDGNCSHHLICEGLYTISKANLLKFSEISYFRNIHCDHAKNLFNKF